MAAVAGVGRCGAHGEGVARVWLDSVFLLRVAVPVDLGVQREYGDYGRIPACKIFVI